MMVRELKVLSKDLKVVLLDQRDVLFDDLGLLDPQPAHLSDSFVIFSPQIHDEVSLGDIEDV